MEELTIIEKIVAIIGGIISAILGAISIFKYFQKGSKLPSPEAMVVYSSPKEDFSLEKGIFFWLIRTLTGCLFGILLGITFWGLWGSSLIWVFVISIFACVSGFVGFYYAYFNQSIKSKQSLYAITICISIIGAFLANAIYITLSNKEIAITELLLFVLPSLGIVFVTQYVDYVHKLEGMPQIMEDAPKKEKNKKFIHNLASLFFLFSIMQCGPMTFFMIQYSPMLFAFQNFKYILPMDLSLIVFSMLVGISLRHPPDMV